jgi:hypothetical protein
MSDISEETHEFRQGNGTCFYSTIRDLLRIKDTMNNERLHKSVNDKIKQSKKLSKQNLFNDTNENNKIIKNVKTTDQENELKALVLLCKKIFCVIFVIKNDQIASSVCVHYYGENLLFQECVYIIYDEQHKHFDPLYLFNKNNPDESMTIFDRKNPIIKILLQKFFKEHLKCKKKHKQILKNKTIIFSYFSDDNLVQLDDQTDTVVSDMLPRVQS